MKGDDPMSRFAVILYTFGAVIALLSIALDAFAAHGLVAVAPAGEQAVIWFQTGTRFQMNHALGLLIVTAISERLDAGPARTLLRAAAVAMAAATLLFPGSLYAISFGGPGFLAPYGGYAAMLGWLLLAVGVWRVLGRGTVR